MRHQIAFNDYYMRRSHEVNALHMTIMNSADLVSGPITI